MKIDQKVERSRTQPQNQNLKPSEKTVRALSFVHRPLFFLALSLLFDFVDFSSVSAQGAGKSVVPVDPVDPVEQVSRLTQLTRLSPVKPG